MHGHEVITLFCHVLSGGEYPWNHAPFQGCMGGGGLSIQLWVPGVITQCEYSGGEYSPSWNLPGPNTQGAGTHPSH